MRCPTTVLILVLSASPALAETPDASVRSSSSVDDGDWSLQLAIGRTETTFLDSGVSLGSASQLDGLASLRYGLSDRLTWSIPTLAFAYRLGDRGGTELIPYGGIVGWGLGGSSVEGMIAQIRLGAGATARFWLDRDTALNLGGSVGSTARWAQRPSEIEEFDGTFGPTTWGAAASVGLSHRFGRLTLNLAGRLSATPLVEGAFEASPATAVEVGSVQSVALRSLPLAEVRINDAVTVDLHGSLRFDLENDQRTETLLLGTTVDW